MSLFSLIGFLTGAAGGGGAAAPAVSAVVPSAYPSYSGATGLQDPAGGTNIRITGTDFVSGCTVGFYQAAVLIGSASSVTFNSATEIVATTPALAAGTYDVVVTNPDTQTSGASGAGLHVSWSPTNESWRGLWMPGDYSVTGTAGVDEAGTWTDSSGNAFHLTSPAGSTDAPQASSGCPQFRGDTAVGRFLESTASLAGPPYGASYVTKLDAGTFLVLAKYRSRPNNLTDYYNASVIAGAAATPNLQLSSRGVKAVGYEDTSAIYNEAFAGRGRTGQGSLTAVLWNASTLYVAVDDHAKVGTALPGAAGLSGPNMGTLEVGRSYAGSQYLDADVFLIAATDSVVSDALRAKLHAWGCVQGYVAGSYFVPTTETYHWLKADAGATTSGGGTVLDALADQSGTGDSNKNMAGGYSSIVYTASDPNFGNKPSWGTGGFDTAGVWMTSGAFASPLEGARTAYQVMRGGSVGSVTYYARINNAGSGVGCALLGTPALTSYTASTTGASSVALTIPADTSGVSCVVYNGASSAALWNGWNTPAATGDTGSGLAVDGADYNSLGTGSYPGEATAYDQTEIIVVAGAHAASTREQWMGYLAEKYELALSAA